MDMEMDAWEVTHTQAFTKAHMPIWAPHAQAFGLKLSVVKCLFHTDTHGQMGF